MANQKITMLKLKRFIQMRLAGKSMNEICSSLRMSKTTVKKYTDLAESSGVPLEELRRMDDKQLSTLLQPESPPPVADERKDVLDSLLDDYLKELNKPYKTVQFVWEQYIKEHPDGYRYTQFKKYLKDYKKSKSLSYMNTYVPGREMQVDYAGDPLYLLDKATGEYTPVPVLCCIMPRSNRGFAMAAHDATQENLFHCLSKCMTYMGRVPGIIKSDNMSQWVTHGDARHESSFTEALDRWCEYYDILPDNTRVKAPRDKGPVESLVEQMYKYVYARIRDEVHYDLKSLNKRLAELVEEFNSREQRRYGKSRNEMYFEEEYPVMRELPEEEFIFKYRKEVELPSDYHVIIGSEQHRYSAPYKYIGKRVSVLWNVEHVEIYCGYERIACHDRDFTPGKPTTEFEHMSPEHQAMYKRSRTTKSDYIKKAQLIGPEAKWALEMLIANRKDMTDHIRRTCESFFKYGEKHGEKRLEAVCAYLHSESSVFTLELLKKAIVKADITKITVARTPDNPSVRGASSYSTTSISS